MTLPIRLRLTLTYSGLLFLALALSGGGVMTLLRYRLNMRLDAALDHRLMGVENFLIRETDAATKDRLPGEMAEYASTQPEGHLIEVQDSSGKILLKSDSAPYASRSRDRSFSIYGKNYRTRASGSLETVEESVEEIGFLLLWSSPLLLALIGFSGYWISSRSLRPVDEMTVAARSIGGSDLSARLPVPGSRDEISRLAAAWNEMLARLEESFSRMQRFTADAAHELRTPLAALRTTADLSLRRSRENEEYRQALQQVVEISDRMQSLVETLLATARGHVPDITFEKTPVNVGNLIEDLAAEMLPLMDDRRLTFETKTKPLFAEIDSGGIRRALAILLDNAMKYTLAEGSVRVEMADHDSYIEIRVSDTGSGIPESELPRIFERFYRVDPSRDRLTGGYGLGLAIARQIAQTHHGELSASSLVGKGSIFLLSLPKSQPAQGRAK